MTNEKTPFCFVSLQRSEPVENHIARGAARHDLGGAADDLRLGEELPDIRRRDEGGDLQAPLLEHQGLDTPGADLGVALPPDNMAVQRPEGALHPQAPEEQAVDAAVRGRGDRGSRERRDERRRAGTAGQEQGFEEQQRPVDVDDHEGLRRSSHGYGAARGGAQVNQPDQECLQLAETLGERIRRSDTVNYTTHASLSLTLYLPHQPLFRRSLKMILHDSDELELAGRSLQFLVEIHATPESRIIIIIITFFYFLFYYFY